MSLSTGSMPRHTGFPHALIRASRESLNVISLILFEIALNGEHFVGKNAVSDGDVQRFEIVAHRNAHGFIGHFNQVLVRAGAFVAHEERDFAHFVRLDFLESLFAVKVRRDDRVALEAQEVNLLDEVYVALERNAEERARGTAHDLGIERIHRSLAENDAGGFKAEARAENRAGVARGLYGVHQRDDAAAVFVVGLDARDAAHGDDFLRGDRGGKFLHLFRSECVHGDREFARLRDDRIVRFFVCNVNADDEIAVVVDHFLRDARAFRKEPSFAFTALFGGECEKLAEPRRVRGVFFRFGVDYRSVRLGEDRFLVARKIRAVRRIFGNRSLAEHRSAVAEVAAAFIAVAVRTAFAVAERSAFAVRGSGIAVAVRAAFAVRGPGVAVAVRAAFAVRGPGVAVAVGAAFAVRGPGVAVAVRAAFTVRRTCSAVTVGAAFTVAERFAFTVGPAFTVRGPGVAVAFRPAFAAESVRIIDFRAAAEAVVRGIVAHAEFALECLAESAARMFRRCGIFGALVVLCGRLVLIFFLFLRIFVCHNCSSILSAMDLPSMPSFLYRSWTFPCSTNPSGRPKRRRR